MSSKVTVQVFDGPPGATGGPGGPGPTGFDGNDGEEGWPGPPGQSGAGGRDGLAVPGSDGNDGEDAPVIPGPRGLGGERGPQGFPGQDGEDGDNCPVLINAPSNAVKSFYAHKNGADQPSLISGAYNGVTFPSTFFNIGGCFDTVNNRLLFPAGVVHLDAKVYQSQHAASASGTFVLKFLRQHIGVLISNATPAVITWPTHLLAVDQPIQFSAVGGTLPTPLVALTVYFVKQILNGDQFTIAATRGGAAINTSSAGSGVFHGFCDVAVDVGTAISGLAGFAITRVATTAITNGTDFIILNYFQTDDGTAGVLDGNPGHTYWSGHWIGPYW